MEIAPVRSDITAQNLTGILEYGEVVGTVTPIVNNLNNQNVSLETIQSDVAKLQAFVNTQGGPPLVQALRTQVASAISTFQNNIYMTTQTQAPTEDGMGMQTINEDVYSDSNGNNPITFASYMQNPNQTAYSYCYEEVDEDSNPEDYTWEAVMADGQAASAYPLTVQVTSTAVGAMQNLLNFINNQ